MAGTGPWGNGRFSADRLSIPTLPSMLRRQWLGAGGLYRLPAAATTKNYKVRSGCLPAGAGSLCCVVGLGASLLARTPRRYWWMDGTCWSFHAIGEQVFCCSIKLSCCSFSVSVFTVPVPSHTLVLSETLAMSHILVLSHTFALNHTICTEPHTCTEPQTCRLLSHTLVLSHTPEGYWATYL